MKVIKYGPGWKPKILICDSCKSELEYIDMDIDVTHWMPLPIPPTEKE